MFTRKLNIQFIAVSIFPERIIETRDDLRMLQLTEELLLIHNGVDTAFGDDASFGHLLHSV